MCYNSFTVFFVHFIFLFHSNLGWKNVSACYFVKLRLCVSVIKIFRKQSNIEDRKGELRAKNGTFFSDPVVQFG